MWYKVAPLKSSFMLAAMLGFMITTIYTAYGRIPESWGFAFGFLFTLMFIASFISMNNAPVEPQLEMDDHMGHHAKKKMAVHRAKRSQAKAAKKKSKK